MPNTFDADAVAAKLLHAHRARMQLGVTDIDQEATTLDDAYAIHTAVMRELGPVGAFKTSKTPDGTQIKAPIAASGVRNSGAVFTADELVMAGIELEIAFRFEADPPSPDVADFEDMLRAAVVALPAIEVVDTRLAFHETCHPMMKLADNQFNAGLVVGAPVRDWQGLDLAGPQHTFHAGDALVSDGPGTVPGGTAFDILAGFVRVVGNHCGGLRAGQYVTTGALSGLHWIEKGRRVTGSIEGLGDLDVMIEA